MNAAFEDPHSLSTPYGRIDCGTIMNGKCLIRTERFSGCNQGRQAVITFHSLEDRIVKNAMAAAAKGCTCPPSFPVCVCGNKPKVKLISKKPIVSGSEELERNPRARSAKLRVCEKL